MELAVKIADKVLGIQRECEESIIPVFNGSSNIINEIFVKIRYNICYDEMIG